MIKSIFLLLFKMAEYETLLTFSSKIVDQWDLSSIISMINHNRIKEIVSSFNFLSVKQKVRSR